MSAVTNSPTRSLTLAGIRERATQLYTLIAWLHVPAVALIALNGRNAWLAPTVFLAVVAVIATICARTMRNGLPLRLIMAAALTCAPIAFVYAGRGALSGISGHGDWQIDYHMYFFAMFAILVAYVDWTLIAYPLFSQTNNTGSLQIPARLRLSYRTP